MQAGYLVFSLFAWRATSFLAISFLADAPFGCRVGYLVLSRFLARVRFGVSGWGLAALKSRTGELESGRQERCKPLTPKVRVPLPRETLARLGTEGGTLFDQFVSG